MKPSFTAVWIHAACHGRMVQLVTFPLFFSAYLQWDLPILQETQSLGIQLSIKQPPTVWRMRWFPCTKEKSHWEKKTLQDHLSLNIKCDCTLFKVGLSLLPLFHSLCCDTGLLILAGWNGVVFSLQNSEWKQIKEEMHRNF